MRPTLGADGHFTLRGATEALQWRRRLDGPFDAVGQWGPATSEGERYLALTVLLEGSSPGLDGDTRLCIGMFGSAVVLCPDIDPDADCQSGFHR